MIIVTPRCGYSLICRPISSFIGYDKELDCRVLFIALVDSKATNIKSYKPVTTFSPVFQYKMTGGNDNHIADKHRSPNVMFRSLLMMAAIISVPSVLPFAERASLWQLPHSNDIIYHNIRNLVCHYPDNAVCQYLHDRYITIPATSGRIQTSRRTAVCHVFCRY